METNNHSYTMEARVMMKKSVEPGISALRIGDGEFGIELKIEDTAGGGPEYRAYCLYDGESRISAAFPRPYDNWQHVALTVAHDESIETSTFIIYINGHEAAKDHWGGKVADFNGDIKIDNLFSDKVAEIRLWNVARTENEIKTCGSHSLTGREPGLMTRLPVTSPYSLATFGGKCLEVHGDAGSGIIRIADSALPRITVEFWARIKHTGAGDIITYESAGTGPFFSITGFENTTVKLSGATIKTGVNIADGAWHHMAVTWRSLTGEISVYKNGKKEFNGRLATGTMLPDTGTLRLHGQFQLSDFRIWETARPRDEIAWDMLFRLTGKEPGLACYWRLDGENRNAVDAGYPMPNPAAETIWVDSGLLLREPPCMQAKAMRNQWDMARNETAKGTVAVSGLDSRAVGVDTLIHNLNSQITNARRETLDKEYYLGNVSMSLKAIPLFGAYGDSKMIFPTSAHLEKIEPDQLSTVNLNFYPKYKGRKNG